MPTRVIPIALAVIVLAGCGSGGHTSTKTPQQLARITLSSRSALASISTDIYGRMSPEGQRAYNELARLTRDGLDNDEISRASKDADVLDAELAELQSQTP